MKSTLLSLLLAIGLFCSCQKQDLTQTRIGFYVYNPDYVKTLEGLEYSLYIDQQYSGMLQVSTTETNDSSLMNFHTLDAKKHIIEVKKGNVKVSSTYLQKTKKETKSGTSLQIANYKNGCIFNNLNTMKFSTYAVMQ